MRHALTIDVEEFFQVHALSGVVTMDTWETYPSSVTESTGLIMDLLAGDDI